MTKEEYENIATEIVDACFSVHKAMGPGLLESVYELCLMKEFELRGIEAVNQVTIPLFYKGYEEATPTCLFTCDHNYIIY